MTGSAPDKNAAASTDSPGRGRKYYQRDFWAKENLDYSTPHYRMRKAARIINQMARGMSCDLLDVGCGPATLRRLLDGNIRYHGIDIAIHDDSPSLREINLLENPIEFDGQDFDIVVAQGFFEYVGEFQDQKLAEISSLLRPGGRFLVSFVNFGHRSPQFYFPYSNIRPVADFRRNVASHFTVDRVIPTSHNWNHSEPGRPLLQSANLRWNVNIPLISQALAVEYFFVCSPRRGTR